MFYKKLLCFVCVCVVAAAAEADRISNRRSQSRGVDFESIIERAKSQVYPCLVSVKPIREEFTAGEKKREQILGSGVIISADGIVVTNNHVAEKAVDVKCVLFDKEQVPAKVIGLDPETDIAVLMLILPDDHEPLQYASFGDSDGVQAGQFVMALGSPYGFTRSISLGIISNTKRYIGFETIYKYNTWIQTDAAINPGNSGGPLVNTNGEVIGINTLMGGGENLGFAIPSNLVQMVVERILNDGRVIRAWTGINLQPLVDFYTDTFLDADEGVLISHVDPDSPAEEAGIQPKDLLISINGEKIDGMFVENLPAIRWRLADLPIEEPCTFLIERAVRNGSAKRMEMILTPSEKGKFEGKDFDSKRWNMTVKEISRFRDPDLFFHRKQGVYIRGIRHPGNAANAGLRRRDILLKIDDRDIGTLEDAENVYREILADEEREKKIIFELMRGGYKLWKILDYRTDYTKE